MSDERIREILTPVFTGILGIQGFSVDLEMAEVDEWDSLAHVQLLAAIEAAFGIEIGFEDAVEMISGRSIVEKIAKYLPRA